MVLLICTRYEHEIVLPIWMWFLLIKVSKEIICWPAALSCSSCADGVRCHITCFALCIRVLAFASSSCFSPTHLPTAVGRVPFSSAGRYLSWFGKYHCKFHWLFNVTGAGGWPVTWLPGLPPYLLLPILRNNCCLLCYHGTYHNLIVDKLNTK